MIDFVGPGFTVEHFESGGNASVLIYPGPRRRHFRIMLNAHVDVIPARPPAGTPSLFARLLARFSAVTPRMLSGLIEVGSVVPAPGHPERGVEHPLAGVDLVAHAQHQRRELGRGTRPDPGPAGGQPVPQRAAPAHRRPRGDLRDAQAPQREEAPLRTRRTVGISGVVHEA